MTDIQFCLIDDVEIYWSPHWSSSTTGNRELIRKHLSGNLKSRGFSDLDAILDLNRIPEINKARISISHCLEIGGYALSFSNQKIGFDLEVVSRVREKIVQRVSSKEELLAAPSPVDLWCAKESCYKCLDRCTQANINFSSIHVLNWWEGPSPSTKNFEAIVDDQKFLGQTWDENGFLVRFAITRETKF